MCIAWVQTWWGLWTLCGSVIRKDPEPSVLFTDFGDSALIFRLRVWTVVAHMLTVETAIRFEIDRLFRERGITIAFPQRDIHIRSTAEPSGSEDESGRNDF